MGDTTLPDLSLKINPARLFFVFEIIFNTPDYDLVRS